MKYKKAAIIYNRKSGGGKHVKEFPEVFHTLETVSEEMPIFFEAMSVSATRDFLTNALTTRNIDLILILGGDGTVSSVCNILMEQPKELRVPFLPLPMGSGNTLALDLHVNSAKKAVDLIHAASAASALDVLKITTEDSIFYCVNVLGAGFITDAADFAVRSGKKLGAIAYIIAVFQALKQMRNYRTVITDREGRTLFQTNRAVLVSINNNRKAGASFDMAPNASMTDGLADIIILHNISRLELLSGFLKTFKGKHISCRGCEYFQVPYCRIVSEPKFSLMPDGELFGKAPLEVEVLQNELEVPICL